MLPSDVNDIQLINEIKKNQNSEALVELVNRHTGIYVDIVQRYTYVPKVERDDLIDHKMVNIYSYAMNYDPTRKMKFSSWIGQNIRWQCQRIVHENRNFIHESDTVLDDVEDTHEDIDSDLMNYIKSEVKNVDDPRFAEICRLRHEEPKMTWDDIAKIFNLTKEGARMIYFRNLKRIEQTIYNEIY